MNASGGVPEIDPRDITLKKEIGRGSFGIVYSGVCRGEPVAVKVIAREKGFDEETLDAFRREIAIVSRIFSPHVCLYMGACTHDPSRLMIVTELMKTDLEKLLRERPPFLTLYRRMVMARDCALGLAWLHGSDPIFIHRDVKPSNFLVDENLKCKVTDFGLSQIRRRGERLIDRGGAVGTPLYMSGEVLNGEMFTERSDMYSFGLVLWVMLTGEPPYGELEALSNDSFADAVCAGQRPAIPDGTPARLARLIRECWADDPAERPTSAETADALHHTILDVAVLDAAARSAWDRAFGTRIEVPWDDAVDALADMFGVADGDDGSHLAYLHALLARRRGQGGIDVVSLEWFGRVIDWFGPLTDSAIDEMYATLEEPWFHGDVPTNDAQRLLANQSAGAFLVRFSNQTRGYFTISRVAANRAVHHQRVQHMPMSREYRILDQSYPSLQALIAAQADAIGLTLPCGGSVFSSIAHTEALGGYLGDDALTQSQELALRNTEIGDAHYTDDDDDDDDDEEEEEEEEEEEVEGDDLLSDDERHRQADQSSDNDDDSDRSDNPDKIARMLLAYIPMGERAVDVDINEIICGICTELLTSPVQCVNGHLFCKACIERAQLYSTSCPTCRVDITQLSRNLFVSNVVSRITVRCRYFYGYGANPTKYDGACLFVDARNAIFKHEATCQHAWVLCPNILPEGGEPCRPFRLLDLQQHMVKCRHRPTTCRHCNETVPHSALPLHNDSCAAAPVVCLFCSHRCARSRMQRHVDDECELILLPCPYGCAEKVRRNAVETHDAEHAQRHVRLLASRLAKLEAQISTHTSQPAPCTHRFEIDVRKALAQQMCTPPLNLEDTEVVIGVSTPPSGGTTIAFFVPESKSGVTLTLSVKLSIEVAALTREIGSYTAEFVANSKVGQFVRGIAVAPPFRVIVDFRVLRKKTTLVLA